MDEDYGVTVQLLIFQALERLDDAAWLLRGPSIPPGPDQMRVEKAVTRAIETLRAVAELPRKA